LGAAPAATAAAAAGIAISLCSFNADSTDCAPSPIEPLMSFAM